MIEIVLPMTTVNMTDGFAPSPLPIRPSILDAASLSQRLQNCFSTIKDPRVERSQLHERSDILIIAILSVIAGGNGWEDMELYGLSKRYGYRLFWHCRMGSQVQIPA